MSTRPLSAEVYAKIRRLRKLRDLSGQELAARMTAQGYPTSRSQIANAENGRVREMSIDFGDHAARALGTTLAGLLAGLSGCPTCKGEPPTGFTCNSCGAEGSS